MKTRYSSHQAKIIIEAKQWRRSNEYSSSPSLRLMLRKQLHNYRTNKKPLLRKSRLVRKLILLFFYNRNIEQCR